MKTKRINNLRKFNWILSLSGACLFFFILFLTVQKSQTQTVTDEKRQKEINKELKEQKEMFYKVSSTQKSSDDGNRIVAIRRILLNFEDLDQKGFALMNQKEMIEIEVYSKLPIPATNARQYLIIGDKAFSSFPTSADGHTIFVHLTQAEFNEIKDNSIISFVITSGVMTDNNLKESYKIGEPEEIPGAKFGRINKAMISNFPLIEENQKSQLLRISTTKNKVQ